jgi:hypothetical protein
MLVTGAISIARVPVKHELTKYIGVGASFVYTVVQDQVPAQQYVPSELQLNYFFIKVQTRANMSSSSPNLVLLIHHQFEGAARDV